jgi:hypothetical protein
MNMVPVILKDLLNEEYQVYERRAPYTDEYEYRMVHKATQKYTVVTISTENIRANNATYIVKYVSDAVEELKRAVANIDGEWC